MTTIAWYATLYGYPSSSGGPLNTSNSGATTGLQDIYLDAGFVGGSQAGVIDVNIVSTPLPGSAPGDLVGSYTPGTNVLLIYFAAAGPWDEKPSGTWAIRVYVDGVAADGELVLTATNNGYGYYSDVSWGWNPTVPELAEPFWTRLKLTEQAFSI